jgi:teichuronic acid biosynthesis glycosyltransferase TuaC
MRILFVTPMFPNERNVQQGNFVWELARALQAAEQDVRVASIEPVIIWPLNLLKRYRRQVAVADVPEYNPIVRYEVRQFPRNIGMFYMYKHWAKVLMDKINTCWPAWRPQIVHSHTLVPGALIAEILCRKWNIAHISTSHGGDTSINIYRRKPMAAIKRMLYEGHHVVGVGQPIVESLKAFAKKQDQIRCIFNGMDTSKLRPASPKLRQRFCGRKIILGTGNLKKTKGFDLLLKGFSVLSEEFPMWDVVIVGGGAQSDELKKLTDELNLFDRVHFTGPLPSSEAMEWMDLCDIFCLPSWSEGFGIVYIEAMACSKPVIGVSGQGIDAVIREHSTGLLVEPKDVTSVTDALRRLMPDDSLRRQMGDRGRIAVFEKFTWAVCAQKYIQLYNEILANKQIGIVA